MADHHEVGKDGEARAANFLKEKGYDILETNWRYRRAEVDIIARDEDVLVFIEVKTRSSAKWGAPELSVNARKQQLLADAASAYMEETNHGWAIRFDILSVIIINEAYEEIKHFQDAFLPGS